MPYLGRTPFLRKQEWRRCARSWCQCPISGALHFYIKNGGQRGMQLQVCQCPISVALHFYEGWQPSVLPLWRCQCPISGALHFYTTKSAKGRTVTGVNALSRAHSISTSRRRANPGRSYCVNALSRAHSISTVEHMPPNTGKRCVNALSRAHSISTKVRINFLVFFQRVNALSRAHSISTILGEIAALRKKMCQCPISGALHFYRT